MELGWGRHVVEVWRCYARWAGLVDAERGVTSDCLGRRYGMELGRGTHIMEVSQRDAHWAGLTYA